MSAMKAAIPRWCALVCVCFALADVSRAEKPVSYSGIYPHLAMTNCEGECGTGAVVPWADRLWVITYGPHLPVGSSDKLYEIDADLNRTVRPESVGGTPANRLIHRETKQLLIGPYIINDRREVKVIPPWKMPGRLTAAARHLTDPARKAYVATMETGLFELDLTTGEPTTLIRENGKNDGCIDACFDAHGGTCPFGWHEAPVTKVPGYHAKGLSSGFGKVFVSNNGEDSAVARRDPFATSGVLADWSEFGQDWRTIRRNQFTEVTTRDGIYGNEHPEENPIWALGWDASSVLLAVNENNVWRYWRLPKGSHSYDGAHGWNTEWPRIREIGEGTNLLATMHGTFWHFPDRFSHANAAGIRPRSTYLKVIGDFCRWGGKVVFGCDDHAKSEFLNTRALKGKRSMVRPSESNLWFVNPSAIDAFGPREGKGAVWIGASVKAGETSDPYLFAGYDRKWLWLSAPATLSFDIKGDGQWTNVLTLTSGGHDLSDLPSAEWVRVTALQTTPKMTAVFHYGAKGRTGDGAEPFTTEAPTEAREVFMNDTPLPTGVVLMDEASLVIPDGGINWRFPCRVGCTEPMRGRICREVSTERDLLHVGDTFYELPADNAGGIRFVHPVATTARPIDDYDTWKGLLIVREKGALYAGAADDLWRLGAPCGVGGPWNGTSVKAHEPSDPYLMNGFTGEKILELAASEDVTFSLEADITGTGVWLPVASYSVQRDVPRCETLPVNFAAYWVRLRTDRVCKARAQFVYNPE